MLDGFKVEVVPWLSGFWSERLPLVWVRCCLQLVSPLFRVRVWHESCWPGCLGEEVWGCLGGGPSTQNDLYSKRLVGKVLDPIDFTVVASMKAACGCGGIGRRTRFRF